ncbi:MAG TPA: FAD-dependent oxidoreductase [Gammaproteobacteria bacterium]|jgi:NADH dehydrogenase|nr:FAD-dependent oxidoreductase [Gammaproteobacteria bacterium]
MKKILIIGGGFAGVWSALSAVRLRRIHNKESEIEITLLNKDDYHGMRPRYYEEDLSEVRVPLEKILTPIGVKYKLGEVIQIDPNQQKIHLENASSELETLEYDRLILAAGSHLYSPPIPGLSTYGFNVDTYAAAEHLANHLSSLSHKPEKGRYTIVVVGDGFTGVEAATDLIDRLRKIAPNKEVARVIVVDHSEIASTLGSEPQQVIHKAFQDLKIGTKTNVHVSKIEQDHIELDSGELIDTQTVVWTAGMRASALTKEFSVELDRFGRLPVDSFLQIKGIKHCFAAGDVAAAMTDETHCALLSCQHAMPQGRVAGHNAVADLLNESLVAYEQRKFVVSIDLGSWGALYAEGWDQHVLEQGEAAKKIKIWINHERIYPPVDGNMETLLEVAAPVFREIQTNKI